GKVAKVYNMKSSFQLVDKPDEEPAYSEPEPEPEQEDTRKGKAIVTEEQAAQSLLALHTPKKRITTDQFILQRRTLATEDASFGPSTQTLDDISANIIRDSLSHADAKTGARSDKTCSGVELDQDQAGSDPGETLESRPQPKQVHMEEDQAGPDPVISRMALAGPELEPTHDEFMVDFYPKVQESLKFPADKHVILEDPLSLTETLSSMKNLEDAYAIGINSLMTNPLMMNWENSMWKLKWSLWSLFQYIKRLPLFLHCPHQDLSGEDMKEMLRQRMFETGSFKSLPKHITLYKALEESMECAQRDEFLAEKDKSRKRRRDDQVDDIPIQDSDNISDSEDTNFAHLPKTKQRPEWLKPIPDDERPSTLEPVSVIPMSHIPDVMEECHKMLTDQIDWANLEGDQVRIDISKPLPLSGPPGHVTIQSQFFFNKDLDYLHYGSKGSGKALSISKMKAAHYHDFGLELLVLEHMWINDVRILSVVRIKAYSRYGYDYLKEITLRRADHQKYTIAEKDYKNLYPSDFEDLNLLLLQRHLNHLPGSDIRFEFKHDYTIIDSPHAVVFPVSNNERKIMWFNEICRFSDGTLTNIMEAVDYRVKEYKVNRLHPGMNTRFWTDKDVERRKEFIHAIERRLKT
ncbi:hypothetical protein Tco_0150216, partial [Tanacetum coccineum]